MKLSFMLYFSRNKSDRNQLINMMFRIKIDKMLALLEMAYGEHAIECFWVLEATQWRI